MELSTRLSWPPTVEIGFRDLGPAVIDRRAHSIRGSAPDVSGGDAERSAKEQIQHIGDEHFSIDTGEPGEETLEAAPV